MDIEKSKIELAKVILNLESPDLVKKIHELIISRQSDFWHNLTDEEKDEIQLGLSQLDRGERIAVQEYLKKYKS